MGRKSGNMGRRRGPVRSAGHSSDDEVEPDPTSRSYVYDEVDEFHADRTDKVLLEGVRRSRHPDESEDEREEVYALSGDDEDDDDEENLAYFEALANEDRDDLASDLDDDHRDDLPNDKAWGTDKATFYDTDFVDNDRGYFKESELRLAEAEEREAMDMQKRMLEQLDDDDFGLDLLQKTEVPSHSDGEDGTRVGRDVGVMSKQEKLEVVRRESPELPSLLEDFRDKLLEIKNVVQPLVVLANEGTIPRGSVSDYIHLKHQLLLNYCTNVCFYVMLKAERTDTTNRPIVKRLVGYRKLMKTLVTVDVQMTDRIAAVINHARAEKDFGGSSRKRAAASNEVRFTDDEITSSDAVEISTGCTTTKTRRVDPSLTTDEKDALRLYALMQSGRGRRGRDDAPHDDEERSIEEEDDGNVREADASIRSDGNVVVGGKRRITSQIEKNKGLTPYRKKDRRNPRVKHRNKFRKAKIRRKGQVQEVRRETKKYSGEVSGIRIGTSRSIKLK